MPAVFTLPFAAPHSSLTTYLHVFCYCNHNYHDCLQLTVLPSGVSTCKLARVFTFDVPQLNGAIIHASTNEAPIMAVSACRHCNPARLCKLWFDDSLLQHIPGIPHTNGPILTACHACKGVRHGSSEWRSTTAQMHRGHCKDCLEPAYQVLVYDMEGMQQFHEASHCSTIVHQPLYHDNHNVKRKVHHSRHGSDDTARKRHTHNTMILAM